MKFLYLPLKYFTPRFVNVQGINFNYDNTFLFILLFFMYSMELSSITHMLYHLPYLKVSCVKFCGGKLRLHTNNPSGKDPISQPL
jgi:hypothetical protein